MPDMNWDDAQTDAYLANVAEFLIPQIAEEVKAVAEGLAPVRRRHGPIPPWARRGHVGGYARLKTSVVSWDGIDEMGHYWRVGALWYGRFLDPKARQLHFLRPFLVTALRSTVEGRTYHVR